ncbi:uncharacterized protein A4U43_C07F1120 [Asparagus officinalis]|uniref:Galactose oxidase-like Early set domain-containing protein n=1 Tax=Asparagus officinalis TaxID=4686 RepID=A0A5P1EBR8_ASPOF|nr:uncharacterized protein A4U43_C07F1120 [Asparagus officinalis]
MVLTPTTIRECTTRPPNLLPDGAVLLAGLRWGPSRLGTGLSSSPGGGESTGGGDNRGELAERSVRDALVRAGPEDGAAAGGARDGGAGAGGTGCIGIGSGAGLRRPEWRRRGFYMVFAVNQGVPSVASWVQLVG